MSKPLTDMSLGELWELFPIELVEHQDCWAKARLAAHGYLVMADRDLNKGYTPEGFAERVFHVHLRIAGDNDELYFRDYLNAHPDVAREYESLKLSLWREFEHDRDGYTQAKTAFVRKYTDLAKS